MTAIFLWLGLFLWGCGSTPTAEVVAEQPDVMLVVLDTVRADRLSTYGHSRLTSVQLSNIAEAGVRFADVLAPSPWTWPSHASMFTGLYPWEHGAHWASNPEHSMRFPQALADRQDGWSLTPLRPDIPTLAEQFSQAGYRTVAVSSNCLLLPELGLMRGFQQASCEENDARTVDKSLAELRSTDSKPLFLLVNLLSAHAPYLVAPKVPWSVQHQAAFDPAGSPLDWAQPYVSSEHGPGLNLQAYPTGEQLNGEMLFASGKLNIPPEDITRVSDLYDGDLVRLDNAMLQLLLAWNRRGIKNILAVTSDHGEYLGEHQRIGHGLDLHPEVLQVPLVIAAPGRLPQGKVIEQPVSLRRLPATLLELASIQTKGAGLGTEQSLMRVLEGKSMPYQLAAVWGSQFWGKKIADRYGQGQRYIRQGKWVGIMSQAQTIKVYDYANDPQLEHDVAAANRHQSQSLQKIVSPTFAEKPRSAKAPEVSPEALQRLKSLGYVE